MKLENDMVVHCDTKEKAKKLVEMVGGELELVIGWDDYKEETCYHFHTNLSGYSPRSFYEDNDYHITEFDNLDLPSYENENQNSEFNTDLVNHPKHYQLKNGLEVIDVVEAFTDGLEGIDAVDIGNAVKYLGRLGKKDDSLQEVEKAKWYLTDYIKRHKND